MSKLTLAQANAIIAAAFEKAHASKFSPLAVVVIDDGGNIVSAQRDDGASMFRIDVGLGKAWAAVGMGMHSRGVFERAQGNPNFFVALASTGKGKFLPQTGAVLIKDAAGNVVGSAGASGGSGDEDEACCAYGAEQAGLKPVI